MWATSTGQNPSKNKTMPLLRSSTIFKQNKKDRPHKNCSRSLKPHTRLKKKKNAGNTLSVTPMTPFSFRSSLYSDLLLRYLLGVERI